jgi:purine-binding chemotaxis protein CheW
MTHDDTGPPLEIQPAAIGVGVPHLGFFLGAELFGVPLTRLREVARLTRVRAIPGAAPHVAGLVNLRGEIICALDAHAILGLPPSTTFEAGFLIALQDFSYPVGLVVDAIADIFSIDPDTIAAPLAGSTACVVGTANVSLGSIGLIDLDRVVDR